MLGQRLVPIARQERSSDSWGSGSDADSITIGLMLSQAQDVDLMLPQHLEMVDQHRTNVRHKQRKCVLYSDGTALNRHWVDVSCLLDLYQPILQYYRHCGLMIML